MEKKIEKEETVDIYNPVTDTTYRIRKRQTTKDITEEWEKELRFSYGHLYFQNENGEFCKIIGETEDIIEFIKQLLKKKEKETREEVLKEVLSKLKK